MAATASNVVPHDIVEIILSRLPVKSLLRFKGVCKQGSATISDDPKFAENHLRLSNTSSSSYLGLHKNSFARFRLENEELEDMEELSTMEHQPSRLFASDVLCHCDGILVYWRGGTANVYVVWNPSTRTHKEVRFPYPKPNPHSNPSISHHSINCGICYDPLIKDYKVVIGDAKNYAVYYCKANSWSELREINNVKIKHYDSEGVHCKGSIYWISAHSRLKDGIYTYEIVCFDGRDEKFKSFRSVDCIADGAKLTSSRDCLYFSYFNNWYDDPLEKLEMVILKKDGDEDEPWMELKLNLELPFPCEDSVQPVCSTHDNKIILTKVDEYLVCLLYDDAKRRVTVIQTTGMFFFLYDIDRLFPILENLILL